MGLREGEKLLEDYAGLKTPDLREKMILENMPLVSWIAGRFVNGKGCDVEHEDLVGCGVIGLIKAVDSFQERRGASFRTYAGRCIRVEMYKMAEKMSWMPCTSRRRHSRITAAMREFETENGRAATDDEIMGRAGISRITLAYWKKHVKAGQVISLDKYLEYDGGSEMPKCREMPSEIETPHHAAERSELRRTIARSLKLLTERERSVIVLYYYEELKIKEISGALGITVQRVHQIRKRALQKMREKMAEYGSLKQPDHKEEQPEKTAHFRRRGR